jgi:hypothetical protein
MGNRLAVESASLGIGLIRPLARGEAVFALDVQNGVGGQPVVVPVRCFTDVDDSGAPPDVATDIVYVARRLLGLPPVPASFRALDPNIPPDATITANVDAIGNAGDVDTNGIVDVATDLVYLARQLLGLPPVPASFRALDPSISDDTTIGANIEALCP